MIVRGQRVQFESGDICAVDLIKCPTKTGWVSFVKADEGKDVWRNCHGLKLKGHEFVKGNEFLVRQIELHSPRIVFLPGTTVNGRGYTVRLFGNKDPNLNQLIRSSNTYVKNVRSLKYPRRLTIELRGARALESVVNDRAILAETRSTIEGIMNRWFSSEQSTLART